MNSLLKIILSVGLIVSLPTYAGSAQNNDIELSVDAVETFAKDVELLAASKGARAFIIGRVGRPEKDLPAGIKFTHTAIAVYSAITLDSGEIAKGYAIHNLYQKEDKANESKLIIDYPIDFFWGVNTLKAGIIIPAPAIQQRIIDVIAKGKDKEMHNNRYSVIANPFNNTYQNCTEHTLNILNSGIYQTTDMAELKNNAAQHFKPQKINENPVKLFLGNWLVDDVSTEDHTGEIYTTTFTSIGRYLKNNELLSSAIVLESDGSVSQLL